MTCVLSSLSILLICVVVCADVFVGDSYLASPCTGPLGDAACDAETVEAANAEQFHSILSQLVATAPLRLFRVDIQKPCILSSSLHTPSSTASIPSSSSVSVDNLGVFDEDKRPASCSSSAEQSLFGPTGSPPSSSSCSVSVDELTAPSHQQSSARSEALEPRPLATSPCAPVDFSLTSRDAQSFKVTAPPTSKCGNPSFATGDRSDEFWRDLCDDISLSTDEKYVNLIKNPERWTGYNGSKVWHAIYSENCFFSAPADPGISAAAVPGGANTWESSSANDKMCYESRVLYRLLSGVHSSINTHVAAAWRPDKRPDGSTHWRANATVFMSSVGGHPARVRNMHFGFVVLLRAVVKAHKDIISSLHGNGHSIPLETPDLDVAVSLIKRLVDSHVMPAYKDVLSAFNESTLFSDTGTMELKRSFKQVFRNISRLLDCVTCQKCRLHGKLQVLGIGTALKILLAPPTAEIALRRDESVALINSLAALSDSLIIARNLTTSHLLERLRSNYGNGIHHEGGRDGLPADIMRCFSTLRQQHLNHRSHLQDSDPSAELAATGRVSAPGAAHSSFVCPVCQDVLSLEAEVMAAAVLPSHPAHVALKTLADLYLPAQMSRFAAAAVATVRSFTTPVARAPVSTTGVTSAELTVADVVVVGGGLSGLTVALSVLDRGGSVILVDKEAVLGGNSAWASSGVNAVPLEGDDSGDSAAIFESDMVQSSGFNVHHEGNSSQRLLLRLLASESWTALEWLRKRVGVPLHDRGIMGSHSFARTWRPEGGAAAELAGQAIVNGITRVLKKEYGMSTSKTTAPTPPKLRVITRAQVVGLLHDGEAGVRGCALSVAGSASTVNVFGRSVVLATGGYAAGGLLSLARPDLAHLGTTNAPHAVGDGLRLAAAVGGHLTDLQHVQIHPTAFAAVHGSSRRHTLCAEILRGAGSFLIDSSGDRFTNELATRAAMSSAMLAFAAARNETPIFTLVVPEKAANQSARHIKMYTAKSLLQSHSNGSDMCESLGVPESALQRTIDHINAVFDANAQDPVDIYGRKSFVSAPIEYGHPFYSGYVTPAVHYTMGGVSVDEKLRVVARSNLPSRGSNWQIVRLATQPSAEELASFQKERSGHHIPGLYAVGELTGGIHGANRLGGNALTECVVFGLLVGKTVPLSPLDSIEQWARDAKLWPVDQGASPVEKAVSSASSSLPIVTMEEVARHSSSSSCWIVILGTVYDVTDFLDVHPAGPEALLKVAGQDGTAIYEAVHSLDLLSELKAVATLAP